MSTRWHLASFYLSEIYYFFFMLTATLRNNFRGYGTFLKKSANRAFMGSVVFPFSNCNQEKESSNCILCSLLQTWKFQLLKTSKYFFFLFFFFFWLSYFILVVRCDCLSGKKEEKQVLASLASVQWRSRNRSAAACSYHTADEFI